MARLRKGEKLGNENRLWRLLYRSIFGLRETDIAAELGWERRTVNNYLRVAGGFFVGATGFQYPQTDRNG